MAPKEKQKIEIEKSHRDPLLSFNQAVTVDCSDFLGTALFANLEKSNFKSASEVTHSTGKGTPLAEALTPREFSTEAWVL